MLWTLLRVPGLGWVCRLWSSLMLSDTLSPRPRPPTSSPSSSLCRRWGGGGGRNSMLPLGVVLLLCPSSSWLMMLGVLLVGGAGAPRPLTWLQLLRSKVPRLLTPAMVKRVRRGRLLQYIIIMRIIMKLYNAMFHVRYKQWRYSVS